MTSSPVSYKIRRLRQGRPPRLLDLFAGCGGLSLGFHSTGFHLLGAVEFDPIAAATHARNFHPGAIERHSAALDITKTDPGELADSLGLRSLESSVDVIVGGPPCQAFARVGRAKLREVADHPEAFLKDPRSNLYLRYLSYVRAFRPLALLMENVPDVLNHGGHNVAEEMCEALDELGYVSAYTLTNSAFYGVPQMRERAFLIAYSKTLGVPVTFPHPTHWIELPRGYNGSRQVALNARAPLLFGDDHYVEAPRPDPGLLPAVTAEDALSDLPRITAHLRGEMKRGARRFVNLVSYGQDPQSNYARLMREWPGFEQGEGIFDHVIRYLPRDYAIFRRMKPGDQYPQAHAVAVRLFEERLAVARKEGPVTKGSRAYRELWKATVPPYDATKFPNKWRKMERDKPARTLMAHLGKDGYSHIHYDSRQARTISVREAARLQSFPDGFILEGTMNPAFRQIGNAVPPLMARAMAEQIRRQLSEGKDRHAEARAQASYTI